MSHDALASVHGHIQQLQQQLQEVANQLQLVTALATDVTGTDVVAAEEVATEVVGAEVGTSVPALDFAQLPNEAQALVCSLASTPSCPSYMLLARVSKSWGQAAAQHLQLNGASVALELVDTPQRQRQRQEQRLASLEAWLRQYGHLATSMSITETYHGPHNAQNVVGRGEVVADILDAVAAAGSWSGSLRLSKLRVPVAGSVKPSAIVPALSGCHQLRELQLDANWSNNGVHYSEYLEGVLPAALQQQKHLTKLILHLGVVKKRLGSAATVSADEFFASLPPCLEVLELDSKVAYERHPTCSFRLCISSLQHLVALRELAVPNRVLVECRKEGAMLDALTALTHISCTRVLREQGAALLEAPNLASIKTGFVTGPCLHALAGRTALRSLSCCVDEDGGDDAAVAVALAQLTMLTHLVVRMDGTRDAPPRWASLGTGPVRPHRPAQHQHGGSAAAAGGGSCPHCPHRVADGGVHGGAPLWCLLHGEGAAEPDACTHSAAADCAEGRAISLSSALPRCSGCCASQCRPCVFMGGFGMSSGLCKA
jgi:hypothetical protein